MIVRFGGGKSGIVEYLITGKKKGRENTRDELDQRVTLAGDLSITNSIINSMTTKSDKYTHFSMSFKEDELSIDELKKITDEYQSLLMGSFRDDEYNIYLEAHLPKIKTITNKETGEIIQRFIHVHGVIPKINLLSGGYLNPAGMTEKNINYLDAIQEFINNKHGLSSPKDNKRTEFNSASEIISRIRNDIFASQNKSLKNEILEIILDKNISSFTDLAGELKNIGNVKIVDSKNNGQYINIKMPDSKKGANLKEFVFSDEFLKLSQNEKYLKLLQSDVEYKTTSTQRESKENEQLVDEWKLIKSKEVKLINSGNKRLYEKYKLMSNEEKIDYLNKRECAFYNKHDSNIDEVFKYERNDRQQGFEKTRSLSEAKSIDGLRKLSERDLDANEERSKMFLRNDEINNLGIIETRRNTGLRRNQRIVNNDIDTSNCVEQSLIELHTIRANMSFAQIKRNLPAGFLLKQLAESHGLIINKYKITKAKDLTDRILCGTRNLNISDFLTKEVNMSFEEAQNYITSADSLYRDELAKKPELLSSENTDESKSAAVISLRNEFDSAAKVSAAEAWKAQNDKENQRESDLKRSHFSKMNAIKINAEIDTTEKIRLGAIQKNKYEAELKEFDEQKKSERRELFAKLKQNEHEQYLTWLAEQVDKHNRADALEELIRLCLLIRS